VSRPRPRLSALDHAFSLMAVACLETPSPESFDRWEAGLKILLREAGGGPGWGRCVLRAGAAPGLLSAALSSPAFRSPLIFQRQAAKICSRRDCILVGRPASGRRPDCPPIPVLGGGVWYSDSLGLLPTGPAALTLLSPFCAEKPSSGFEKRFEFLNPGWGSDLGRLQRGLEEEAAEEAEDEEEEAAAPTSPADTDLRDQLTDMLRQRIARSGLTQVEAASRLSIKQPRLSEVLARRKRTNPSTLMRYINKLS